jgi:hypothetical protein
VSIAGPEYYLLLVAFTDTDTMICIFKVKLGEDPGTYKTVQGFINKWERISILNGDFIKSLVINT